jgi:hypothetical protein
MNLLTAFAFLIDDPIGFFQKLGSQYSVLLYLLIQTLLQVSNLSLVGLLHHIELSIEVRDDLLAVAWRAVALLLFLHVADFQRL